MLKNVFLCFLLALCIVTPSHGQKSDFYVQPVFMSKHYIDGEYNEVNPGVFLTYSIFIRSDVMVGVVQNSFRKTSFALGMQVSYSVCDYVSLSASLGVATGYSDTHLDIGPQGLIVNSIQSVSVGPRSFKIMIRHVPGAVILGFQMPIGDTD